MKVGITTLFLGISCSLFSQSAEDILRLQGINKKVEKTEFSYAKKEFNNEFDIMFSGLFLFYKEFLSSQDANSCSFTPSCSEYALKAIKRKGVAEGMTDFFDRFSRCNGLSPENYAIHPETKLLHDPVD